MGRSAHQEGDCCIALVHKIKIATPIILNPEHWFVLSQVVISITQRRRPTG